MRKLITLTTAALFAAGASVPAYAYAEPKRQDAPAATPSPTTDAQADTKRYCVSGTVTGSRLARKTCKTRAQWISEDNFDPLDPER